jgi:aspartate carbamoyltransferase regulatory subunit
MRAYKVYAIENGTVIDHIDGGKALKVVEILNLKEYDQIVTIGMNLDSKKLGKKDIVKIEKKMLTKDELNRIALIAPRATINIIRDSSVVEKFKVEIPECMDNLIRCPNPNCITRVQSHSSKFFKASEVPLRVKCNYCERVFDEFTLL